MINLKKSVSNFIDIVLPFALLGLYYGFTSTILCIILLFIKIIFSDKSEISLFLILFGTGLSGLFFFLYKIPVPGFLLSLFIGFFILGKEIIFVIRKNLVSFKYLIYAFLVFFIMYLYGPMSEYSNQKLFSTIYVGLLTLIAFLLYNSTNNFSNRDFSQLLLISSLTFVTIALDYLSFSPPSSIFDFYSFRLSSINTRNNELLNVNYHLPAIIALYGFAFRISNLKFDRGEKKYLFLFSISVLYIILVSGARQGLVGFFCLILFRILMLKKSKLKILLNFILFILIIFLLIFNLLADSFFVFDQNNTVESFLNREYDQTFNIIKDNFIFGVGYGGYFNEYISKHKYPHNIIFEVLSEGGLFAFLILLTLVYIFLRKKSMFKYLTNNNSYLFIIFSAFFIRALISEDIGENIAVFAIIFSTSSKVKNNIN